MKTTVDLPEGLLEEVKELANNEKSSVRALIVEGLRMVLSARKKKASGYQMRDVSVKGKGLQRGLADSSWEEIRNLSYEGRGS